MAIRSYRCGDCAWNYTGEEGAAIEQARIHRLIHRRRVEQFEPETGDCIPEDSPDDEDV